ncbi:MAG: BatA domain-containing protein, partial [Acidimicrobiales bacterium]
MNFLAAERLWLLVLVAALAAAYVVIQRRRPTYAVRFTNLELLASVAPRRPGWRRHVPAAAMALALAALVVGLARPVRDERVPKEAATVMLVVDVSVSMNATDVSPSRLDAAASAASSFVAD